MFKKVLIGLVVLIAGFLGYVATQPSDFLVAREQVIKASPETLFPYINNSKLAHAWMPWAESDPGVKVVFQGAEEGVGSMSSWESDGKMGTGQAEVVESVPNHTVSTKLTYQKPMVMEQLSTITLTPGNEGTLVRWQVTGKNSFIGRIFCVFMNMDKMVGGEFEKGLRTLKAKVEAQ